MTQDMRGVYPILVMPFDEQLRIDIDSLQQLVDFVIEQGAHGLGVALGSEVFTFTEAERALVTRTVVERTACRVPVVINTGGNGAEQAVYYGRLAAENGADALMVMPSSYYPVSGPETCAYYRAIGAAVSLPIFIQDTSSAHVPADLALQIAAESPNVRYIKVESQPSPLMVQETVCRAGHQLVVFGGAGGNYFVEELRRGAQGTMPFCSQPEAFRAVWDLFQNGDELGATDVFYRLILPVNRLTGLGAGASYYPIHKEILRQRGVIRTNCCRGSIAPLDALVWHEVQAVIDALYPERRA